MDIAQKCGPPQPNDVIVTMAEFLLRSKFDRDIFPLVSVARASGNGSPGAFRRQGELPREHVARFVLS